MSSKINERKLNYALAINEAIAQMMTEDNDVILIGQGVKSPWYVGQTCKDLIAKFGEDRVIDTPVSENAMTGAAVGASLAGMKAIAVHPRMDFLLYAIDPIINEAANWYYMNGGKLSAPVVFWPIINRGGEQGAQHSQALHAMFAHIPGLKVVMPADAYSAKGLMIAAINEPNPVVYIDDRWLYSEEGNVPEDIYEVPIGKARIVSEGKDISIIAVSYMVKEAELALIGLQKMGINAELIDVRTIKPLDKETILNSVFKTGRALIVDSGWKSFGVSAEISTVINENCFSALKYPVKRLALPDCPAPASCELEKEYYLYSKDIIKAVREIFGND